MLIDALPAYITDRIEPVTETGCWIWVGKLNKSGYGTVKFRGKQVTVHRLVLSLKIGKKLDRWALHHCDVPSCCRPDHLYEGGPLENVRDCISRGRRKTARKLRERCKNGHLLSETAVAFSSMGHRVCRICHNEKTRRFWERNSDKWADRQKQQRESAKARYWSDPEYRERIKARVRARYSRGTARE